MLRMGVKYVVLTSKCDGIVFGTQFDVDGRKCVVIAVVKILNQ
jgi:hypothetical protein